MLFHILQAWNCLVRLKCSCLFFSKEGAVQNSSLCCVCTYVCVCVCVGTNVHISGWLVQLTKPFAPGLRMTGTVSSFLRKFAPRCSVCKEPIMPAPGQEETVRIVALDRDFHVQCYRCEVGIPLTAGTESKGWLNFITTSCCSHDRNTLL